VNQLDKKAADLQDVMKDIMNQFKCADVAAASTEGGKAVYQEAREMKFRMLRSMLGALTDDEQEIFMVLFRKIARAAQAQAPKVG
jgi:hypothetical protein